MRAWAVERWEEGREVVELEEGAESDRTWEGRTTREMEAAATW